MKRPYSSERQAAKGPVRDGRASRGATPGGRTPTGKAPYRRRTRGGDDRQVERRTASWWLGMATLGSLLVLAVVIGRMAIEREMGVPATAQSASMAPPASAFMGADDAGGLTDGVTDDGPAAGDSGQATGTSRDSTPPPSPPPPGAPQLR